MPITLENLSIASSANVDFEVNAGSAAGTLSSVGGLVMPSNSPVRSSAYNNGPLAGFKNKIINGRMDVSQRGTSFVSPVSGSVTLDRWKTTYNTAGSFTVAWTSDGPANTSFNNSLRLTVTSADTSITSLDICHIHQNIEGINILDFFEKSMRLSFWFKATVTGSYAVSLANVVNTRSIVFKFQVTAANTWQQFSFQVDKINSAPAGGAWNKTTGIGLTLSFVLAAGTTYQTSNTAELGWGWQTGIFYASQTQVNALNAINNIVAITGVSLTAEEGAAFPDNNVNFHAFEQRGVQTEYALCQRYYQEIGTSGDNILVYQNTNVYPSASSVTYYYTSAYPVTMRPTPTASLITSGGSWGSNLSALTVTPSTNTIRYNMTVGANPASSVYYFQNWNPSNRIVLESEL